MGVGSLGAGDEFRSVVEEEEILHLFGGAVAVEDTDPFDMGREGEGTEVNRAGELFLHLDTGGAKSVQRGDKLIGVGEIDVGGFGPERGKDTASADFSRQGNSVESREILLDRFKGVEAGSQFEIGEKV